MANGRAGQAHAHARESYFNRTKLSDVLGPGILGIDSVGSCLFGSRMTKDQGCVRSSPGPEEA